MEAVVLKSPKSRHSHRLAAAVHRDRHRAGVTVDRLGDGADAVHGHRVVPGRSELPPCRDRERFQVGPVTGRLDHDLTLFAGPGTSDDLLHGQLAGQEVVSVGYIPRRVTGRGNRYGLPVVSGDRRCHRAGVACCGLGSGADGPGWDVVIGARLCRWGRGPRRDGEVRQWCVDAVLVAAHGDRDRPLLPGRRPGDGLVDGQRARADVVGVGDGSPDRGVSWHCHRLGAARHGDRHRAGVPVDCLGDGADAARSHRVALGRTERPRRNPERFQVSPVTGGLDHDLALLTGPGTCDGFLHGQGAGVDVGVSVGDVHHLLWVVDRDVCSRADDLDRNGAGMPVVNLGDRASRAQRDVVVRLRPGTSGCRQGEAPRVTCLSLGYHTRRTSTVHSGRTGSKVGAAREQRKVSFNLDRARIMITVPKPRPASSEKLPARGRRRHYKSAIEAPRQEKNSRLDPQNRDVGSWPAT